MHHDIMIIIIIKIILIIITRTMFMELTSWLKSL